MKITAGLVKELRERTGIGMMDCKKALQESDGSIEKAIDQLRASMGIKAEKASSKVASEGLILHRQVGDVDVLVEVNCQTDFVAKTEDFLNFCEFVKASLDKAIDIDKLCEVTEQKRQELVQKVGENIVLRRVHCTKPSQAAHYYSHGGRIGVICTLSEGTEEVAHDLALHIAANNPVAVSEDTIDAELVEREKSIALTQAMDSGKPKEIAEKMVVGKLAKFKRENSLLGQAYVKNPDISVAEYLKTSSATVQEFVRFEVGEGIEVEEKDFAAEVAEQLAN